MNMKPGRSRRFQEKKVKRLTKSFDVVLETKNRIITALSATIVGLVVVIVILIAI